MDDDEIDADLIRRIAARDFRAMDSLFDRHTAALTPIAARIVRDRSEAEDVVQDSWLQIWRDAAAFDARRGTVEAWLRSIVRSRALDRAAALAARRNAGSASGASGPAETSDDEEETSAPFAIAGPALKGRVMATIQAGGAESVLERSHAAERAFAAERAPAPERSHAASRQPFVPAEELDPAGVEPGPQHAPAAPSLSAPHASSTPPAVPHYPRDREPEPEPIPPHEHEVPMPAPRRGLGWVWTVGWGLAVILAIVAGTLLESTGRLRAIIRARNNELNELHRQAATEAKWAAILGFPGARLVSLAPTPQASPTIHGRAVYAPAAQRALVVLEGALPPAGSDYELWVVRGGVPVSQGVAEPDSRGIAVLRAEAFGDSSLVSAFAVSLEPKGGSPARSAPSGPFVLVGSLAN
jgi:DNA-directed RNA polymerase specialized sigma24 family protein